MQSFSHKESFPHSKDLECNPSKVSTLPNHTEEFINISLFIKVEEFLLLNMVSGSLTGFLCTYFGRRGVC